MNEVLKWLSMLRKRPFLAILVAVILCVLFVATRYYGALAETHGQRDAAGPTTTTITVLAGTNHLGDDIRPDYPDDPEGRLRARFYGFTVDSLPTEATLRIDGYDVDNYGVEIGLNGRTIGRLNTGDPWQETSIVIPSASMRQGENLIRVGSITVRPGHTEDCLIRNIRVILLNK